jgi:hypothetical protein
MAGRRAYHVGAATPITNLVSWNDLWPQIFEQNVTFIKGYFYSTWNSNMEAWRKFSLVFSMMATTDERLFVLLLLNDAVSIDNIVTYSGFAWLIIMGSGFDDWVYWHFFTITVNYNSSHIEFLLNAVWRTTMKNLSLLSESWTGLYSSWIHESTAFYKTPRWTVPLLSYWLSRESCV